MHWSLLIRRVFLLMSLLATGVAMAADEAVWLGMVREDDIVAPFALFHHGAWSRPWPEDSGGARVAPDTDGRYAGSVPLARIPPAWLDALPSPTRWHMLSGEGRPVEIDRALEYETECGWFWGLGNRAPVDAALKRDAWPIEKRGFAASRPLHALFFKEVESDARAASAVMSALGGEWRALEASIIAGAADLPVVFPREQAVRDRVAVRPLHLFSLTPPDGAARWYVEAQKEYAKPADAGDGGCSAVMALQGWVAIREGRAVVVRTEAVATDCDMREFHSLRPMAQFSLDGETFLLGIGRNYDAESYELLRWTDRDVRRVASFGSGGC